MPMYSAFYSGVGTSGNGERVACERKRGGGVGGNDTPLFPSLRELSVLVVRAT